jgi:hypothetical protein
MEARTAELYALLSSCALDVWVVTAHTATHVPHPRYQQHQPCCRYWQWHALETALSKGADCAGIARLHHQRCGPVYPWFWWHYTAPALQQALNTLSQNQQPNRTSSPEAPVLTVPRLGQPPASLQVAACSRGCRLLLHAGRQAAGPRPVEQSETLTEAASGCGGSLTWPCMPAGGKAAYSSVANALVKTC